MPREFTADERKKLPASFAITGGSVRVTAADGEVGPDGKPKLGTFAGNAYTGVVMQPGGWWGSIICDLDGIRVPNQHRPVLRQHDDHQIVGHTNEVKVTDAGVEMAGVFSGQAEHVEKVTVPAKNGFQWQLSIGAMPVRTEFLESGEKTTVNGREVTGPLTISRETELKEISFVPLGADGNTTVSVSASRGRGVMFKAMLLAAKKGGDVKAGKYNDDEIDKMSEDEAKSALKKMMDHDEPDGDEKEKKAKAKAEDEPADEAKAAAQRMIAEQRKAFAAESKRIAEVQKLAAAFPALAAQAVADGWTAEKTEAEVLKAELAKLRASRPGVGVGGPLIVVPGQLQASEAVLEAAVLHAFRHSYQLDNESFYAQPTPDGKGTMARVPHHIKAETLGGIRARYTDQVQQTAHTMFKGRITLHQLLDAAFAAAGASGRFDWKSESDIRAAMHMWGTAEAGGIRAEGASTISISNVLANVMNKFALQGYLFTEQAWREIFGIRPVNDFKPTKSVNLLGDVMYKVIGPTGEVETANLGDQAFSNQAQALARMMTIPWTHIVNDDLSILQTVPQKMGTGAGLAINDSCWTLWKLMAAGTTLGDDGNAFWRTTSSVTAAAAKAGTAYKANKMTGGATALSGTSLQTAKALFDNQIDPNGNPLGFDGLKPTLAFGPSNWVTVMSLLQAVGIVYGGGSAALQPNTNVWQGYFNPVMSRYIESANYVNSTTAWWMLFNPAALAVAEIAFLNGVDTPAVLTAGPDYQFDRLGISIRGTIAYGVNAQNFRGGVYSAGA